MEEYYAISELEPLVEQLIAANADADAALERREAAIKALAERWTAIEAKRDAAFELSAAE